MGRFREQEAAQQQSGSLAGWYVPYFRDISASYLDEVGNYPAWRKFSQPEDSSDTSSKLIKGISLTTRSLSSSEGKEEEQAF